MRRLAAAVAIGALIGFLFGLVVGSIEIVAVSAIIAFPAIYLA